MLRSALATVATLEYSIMDVTHVWKLPKVRYFFGRNCAQTAKLTPDEDVTSLPARVVS